MVLGTPRTFHKKFKWIFESGRFGSAGFQKCSELGVEIANVQYFEGGSLIPNKSPGRLTFSDITLERGATQDLDMFRWASDVVNFASGLGSVEPEFKDDGDLVQQDRDGSTLRRLPIVNAWPVNFVAGEWDNEADENVIEKMTLTYDFFDIAA